jgi:Na+-transporting NADH:ubiquinone oxidoreductase subunit B
MPGPKSFRHRLSSVTESAAAAAPTLSAPHIRDRFSVERAMRYMIVALIPCIVMAFINTGFQANVDLAVVGGETAPGWRVALLDRLGIGRDPYSLLANIAHGGLYFIPVLTVSVLVGGIWERVFAKLRNRPLSVDLPVIALLFTLSLPSSIPLWQAALGMSFAIVMGREIFGGTGRNFLNPVLVGLAFLYVTYPRDMIGETVWTMVDAFTSPTYLALAAQEGPGTISWLAKPWLYAFLGLAPGQMGSTSALACLIGGAFLLYTRIISGSIVAGMLLGTIVTAMAVNQFGDPANNAFVTLNWSWHLLLGSFAFGAVFLATDPASSAMTARGRWYYGLLIGIMVVLIRVASSSHPDGVMFAILFGNMFAPLIDYIVVWTHIRRRARRGV